jgi:ribonuclease VapC
MFVDASALVAILTREPGCDAFVERMRGRRRKYTSAIAVYEASLAVARRTDFDVELARKDVMDFLADTAITVVDLTGDDGVQAINAHLRFGKGRHTAALNMGDCFAYACAKRLKVPLLFKGDDFALTDIRSALDP